MVEYSYKFSCDHCGSPITGDIYILYPNTVYRDDPQTMPDEEPEACEELREAQCNRCYCEECIRKILAFANTATPKRGRPRKTETE